MRLRCESKVCQRRYHRISVPRDAANLHRPDAPVQAIADPRFRCSRMNDDRTLGLLEARRREAKRAVIRLSSCLDPVGRPHWPTDKIEQWLRDVIKLVFERKNVPCRNVLFRIGKSRRCGARPLPESSCRSSISDDPKLRDSSQGAFPETVRLFRAAALSSAAQGTRRQCRHKCPRADAS